MNHRTLYTALAEVNEQISNITVHDIRDLDTEVLNLLVQAKKVSYQLVTLKELELCENEVIKQEIEGMTNERD